MRVTLNNADLARYAGQFVWLALNYDKAENAAFMTKYGANATPTFFVIDPKDEQIAAAQTGAMSLVELEQFLDRGTSRVFAKTQTTADAALLRGDALLTLKPNEAASAYSEALRLAPANWPHRELAQASLVTALEDGHQWQQCAEAAAAAATSMKRNAMFARTVVAGMWCLVDAYPATWLEAQAHRLEPLAKEALSLPTTIRDHRDELYRTLMRLSLARKDERNAANLGSLWMDELNAIKPANDEERSAVDIARVECIQVFGDPRRVLPALIDSERTMPNNWNASVRVAQMEEAAHDYDAAIAACDRGLSRSPGPLGRSWLLQIKAHAFMQKGKTALAHGLFIDALEYAQAIPNKQARDSNITSIKRALQESSKPETRKN